MKDLKLSIVYLTYRPGGFDLLAESLKQQTYTNYELIVIDDYKGRNLKPWLEDQGIPVRYYGPMKKKSLPDTQYNQCNVMNTALMYATGDLLIEYQDYISIMPKSFDRWNEIYTKQLNNMRCLTSAVGIEYEYDGKFKIGDISVFDPPVTNKLDSRFTAFHPWVPDKFELFYSAFPTDYLVEINGFDERADEYCLFWFNSVMAQAFLNNVKVGIDHKQLANIINHRNWMMDDDRLWSIYKTGRSKPDKQPVWYKVSPNGFNMKELRESVADS